MVLQKSSTNKFDRTQNQRMGPTKIQTWYSSSQQNLSEKANFGHTARSSSIDKDMLMGSIYGKRSSETENDVIR